MLAYSVMTRLVIERTDQVFLPERISPEITQTSVCPKCAIGVYSTEQFIKQHVEWNGNGTTKFKWMFFFIAISHEYFFVC